MLVVGRRGVESVGFAELKLRLEDMSSAVVIMAVDAVVDCEVMVCECRKLQKRSVV